MKAIIKATGKIIDVKRMHNLARIPSDFLLDDMGFDYDFDEVELIEDDKRYFLNVRTYSCTNSCDVELKQYVFDKYHHTIINDKYFVSMIDDIRLKINELHKKYPRCKRKVLIHSIIDGCFRLSYLRNAHNGIDGNVFILSSDIISKEYTEGVGL